MKITQAFAFAAAHYLPNVSESHRCRRMHDIPTASNSRPKGRSIRAAASSSTFSTRRRSRPLAVLDHQCLNEIEGLENPSAELIAIWIWDRVKTALPQLHAVRVDETPTCWAEYDGP